RGALERGFEADEGDRVALDALVAELDQDVGKAEDGVTPQVHPTADGQSIVAGAVGLEPEERRGAESARVRIHPHLVEETRARESVKRLAGDEPDRERRASTDPEVRT